MTVLDFGSEECGKGFSKNFFSAFISIIPVLNCTLICVGKFGPNELSNQSGRFSSILGKKMFDLWIIAVQSQWELALTLRSHSPQIPSFSYFDLHQKHWKKNPGWTEMQDPVQQASKKTSAVAVTQPC